MARVTSRRLLSALVAALFSLMTVGAAEAQLWKPKKKSAATVKKPVKKTTRKAARTKRPTRKKASSSVVKFGPPKDRVEEPDEDTARREVEPDEDVDDNPRISVYDGDRDE
jgi:hypothetical protein